MEIKEIAHKIEKEGGNLYLVGGALRDTALGKKKYDEDYCVTGISKEKFQQLFPEAKIIGKAFEVFQLEQREFALARREKKSGIGHTNFTINTGEEITIEEDLARRDITINAMAKHVLTGEWIDPFDGKEDIKKGILRATTKAFKEDPLRVYRVARIAAETGFLVEEKTLLMMQELKSELTTLSKERVFIEFKKALVSNQPSRFLKVLRQAGVLEVHFKEIQNLIGSIQPIQYHPEGDSYQHTLLVLDKCVELTTQPEIRFAALVHDLGKGVTPKEMYPHHYGHDERGIELVKQLGERIGIPKAWIEMGKTAAKEHMKGGIFARMTIPKKVQFIERVSHTRLGLDGLQIVVIADKCSTRNISREEINFATIGKRCIKEVNGDEIQRKYGIKEGKEVASRLHQERIQWMANILRNDKQFNERE